MGTQLQVYTKAADGFGPGTYSNHNLRGAQVSVMRSMFEGDMLQIISTRNTLDAEIHKIRPVRLYHNNVKIFDGCIRAPEYTNKANKFRDLAVKAYGWDKELAAIDLSVIYPEGRGYINKTIDYIFKDLVKEANDCGITKKATYAYDTSKIRDYDASLFNPSVTTSLTGVSVFTLGSATVTGTGTLFTSELTPGDLIRYQTDTEADWVEVRSIESNTSLTLSLPYNGTGGTGTGHRQNGLTRTYSGSLWDAMLDLTKALDAAEPYHAWEWAVKVDALQSEFYIYVIPQMMRTDDIDVSASLPDFKLVAPKSIWKDYTRLVNYANVWGTMSLVNTKYSSTLILPVTAIPTNTEEFDAANQPSARHYLRVTINNSTGSNKTGSVKINGSDGLYNELTERFFLPVPAGMEQAHHTDNRYATLATGSLSSFEVDSFAGCTIKVEEVVGGIAGRSLNMFGFKGEAVSNRYLNSQDKVDNYAKRMVRLFHAPLVYVEAEIKDEHQITTDLIGKRVDMFNNFSDALVPFVCLKQQYVFRGVKVQEKVAGMLYNIDWEYTE